MLFRRTFPHLNLNITATSFKALYFYWIYYQIRIRVMGRNDQLVFSRLLQTTCIRWDLFNSLADRSTKGSAFAQLWNCVYFHSNRYRSTRFNYQTLKLVYLTINLDLLIKFIL